MYRHGRQLQPPRLWAQREGLQCFGTQDAWTTSEYPIQMIVSPPCTDTDLADTPATDITTSGRP